MNCLSCPHLTGPGRFQSLGYNRCIINNLIVQASVLNRAELEKGFAAIAEALVGAVMSSEGMSRQAKEDFLRNLSGWPLVLENVAKRQTCLQRGNGKTPEGDGNES